MENSNKPYVVTPPTVEDLYNDPRNPEYSLARVYIDGNNNEVQHLVSDALYTVESGNGRFVIGGEVMDVKKGDKIFIPRGIPYSNSGKMVLLAFNTPRFNSENVIIFPANDEEI